MQKSVQKLIFYDSIKLVARFIWPFILALIIMPNTQAKETAILQPVSLAPRALAGFVALDLQVSKADQVYQGECERFKVGDSTVYFMAERARQLNEAKMRMIDAEVEYHAGILALKAITSQL